MRDFKTVVRDEVSLLENFFLFSSNQHSRELKRIEIFPSFLYSILCLIQKLYTVSFNSKFFSLHILFTKLFSYIHLFDISFDSPSFLSFKNNIQRKSFLVLCVVGGVHIPLLISQYLVHSNSHKT